MDENLSSHLTCASSPCGSYHRRLYRSHATSIDRSFGRKSEELSEDVGLQYNPVKHGTIEQSTLGRVFPFVIQQIGLPKYGLGVLNVCCLQSTGILLCNLFCAGEKNGKIKITSLLLNLAEYAPTLANLAYGALWLSIRRFFVRFHQLIIIKYGCGKSCQMHLVNCRNLSWCF